MYTLAGIFSMIYSTIFSPQTVTTGASGALFGIMGGMAAELLQNWHLIPTKRERWLSLISLSVSVLINIAIGLLPFIDNFCHVFGFIAGLCLGFPLLIYLRRDEDASCKQQTLAVVGVLVFVFMFVAGVLLVYFRIDANEFCPWCRYISCVPAPWWSCDPPLDPPPASGNDTMPF